MAEDFDELFQGIWQRRDKGMPAPPSALNRPVTHRDIQYLVTQYSFLQLINMQPKPEDVTEPNFITAESGWIIHDYGVALSASPGKYLFGSYPPLNAGAEEDEGGGEGTTELEPGKGTIIKQAVDTAQQMVIIAIQKKWAGIEIVNGTDLMKWAAWMASQDYEYSLTGFTPTEVEKIKRGRIRRLIKPVDLTSAITPGRRR